MSDLYQPRLTAVVRPSATVELTCNKQPCGLASDRVSLMKRDYVRALKAWSKVASHRQSTPRSPSIADLVLSEYSRRP